MCRLMLSSVYFIWVVLSELKQKVKYFFVPCAKFGWPYPGKAHSSRKSSATHSCQCVVVFSCEKQWYMAAGVRVNVRT